LLARHRAAGALSSAQLLPEPRIQNSLRRMPAADFVHLRVHSAYSLSEGALKIPEIVSLCKNAGMPAVAITDTNNLFGALEFSAACKDGGVQPIIGCQMALADERTERGVIV